MQFAGHILPAISVRWSRKYEVESSTLLREGVDDRGSRQNEWSLMRRRFISMFHCTTLAGLWSNKRTLSM
jgi:hypothetical protein